MSTEGFGKFMAFLNKFRGGGKSPKSPKQPAVDISSPCDMRHEVHVGFDNDGVLKGLPESWRLWMQAANIRYFKSYNLVFDHSNCSQNKFIQCHF